MSGIVPEGSFRVWWIPQVPMQPFRVPVKSAEEAANIMNVLAEYDAFQYLNKVKPDYSNAGGLEVFEDGEWLDWESVDGSSNDPLEMHPVEDLGWCVKLRQSPQ